MIYYIGLLVFYIKLTNLVQKFKLDWTHGTKLNFN